MSAPEWASYDAVADTYQRVSVPHYFREPAERLVFLLGVTGSDRLLDVGAGTGIVAATARRTASTVFATDPSWTMLLRANAAARVLTVASELPGLPFPCSSFTCVSAGFVLSHTSDPVTALAEVFRVLRPGGRVGVSSWAVGPSNNEVARMWTDTADQFLDQAVLAEEVRQGLPGEERFADLAALGEVLTGAGFLVRALTQHDFWIRISTEDYLASRSIGMTARLMRKRLSESSWHRFQATVADRISEQLGRRLEFLVRVNFAVGARDGAG